MEEVWHPRPKLPQKGDQKVAQMVTKKVAVCLLSLCIVYTNTNTQIELQIQMQKYNLKSISPTGVHDPREKLVRGTFEVRLVCAVQAHPPAQVNLESTLEMYEIKITSL